MVLTSFARFEACTISFMDGASGQGGAMGTGATEPMGTAVVYSGCDRFVGAPYAAMAIALTLREPLYSDGNRFKLQLSIDM